MKSNRYKLIIIILETNTNHFHLRLLEKSFSFYTFRLYFQEEVQLSNFKCEQILRSCIAEQTSQIRAMWQHMRAAESEAETRIVKMREQYERKENSLLAKLNYYEARSKALKSVMKDLRSYIEVVSTTLQQDQNTPKNNRSSREIDVQSQVEQLKESILSTGLILPDKNRNINKSKCNVSISSEDKTRKKTQARPSVCNQNYESVLKKPSIPSGESWARDLNERRGTDSLAEDEDNTSGMAHAVNEILSKWRRHSEDIVSASEDRTKKLLSLGSSKTRDKKTGHYRGMGMNVNSLSNNNNEQRGAKSEHVSNTCPQHANRIETSSRKQTEMHQ